MPPFSACSMCNVRTKKMAKDPVTLKLIYVCPICFKSTFQEKKQMEAENRKKNAAAKQAKIKRITCEDKSEGIAKKAADLETEKKEQMMRPLQSYNLRVIDPPKVHRIPKATPLLMQTVVIKNRKYVAVCETADNE
ncbi:uncharacterized protein LOC117144339 [Drosophila mauritiana]|uniref:Uncharacterized protein LOC117144339 n=1 Tax=Drosophila mauritiana TaxID=7226 RepID=A0A6P8K928_DROMA|nr:uncharacterized protein LOC117144339 [Drosophila mauritiana]